jgi:hypothetical protein
MFCFVGHWRTPPQFTRVHPVQDSRDLPPTLFPSENTPIFVFTMKPNKAKPTQQDQFKRNEKKWTKTLMDAGYTVFPYVILDRQDAIGLSAVEVNLIMQLANLWWKPESLPFPSKAMLAKRMGCSPKTVQRAFARLEEVKFIARKSRYSGTGAQLSNHYDFTGLINAAIPYAKEEKERREGRRAEDAKRGNRKKPQGIEIFEHLLGRS